MIKSRLPKMICFLVVLIMTCTMLPITTFAANYISNSTVTLHPAAITPTGVKVHVGDRINGFKISKINSSYDIIVDLGRYNVSLNLFKLPYADTLWEGVPTVDYVSVGSSSGSHQHEGSNILLANGGNSVYYLFNQPKTFTLHYDANGGGGAPSSQSYTTNTSSLNRHTFSISTTIPNRPGFDFLGWSTLCTATTPDTQYQPGTGSITVTGTSTLFAVWAPSTPEPPPTYTVTYHDGVDGQEVFQDQVTDHLTLGTNTPSFVGTPTRDGYQFMGWTPAVSNTVTGNAVYTAIWQPIPYTVTYTDGVDGQEVFQDQVTDHLTLGTNTPSFVGTPTRDGYQFMGWTPAVSNTVTGNAVYTAIWQPIPFTVTYTDGVDGQEVFQDQVTDHLTLGTNTPSFVGTPTRDGYQFMGWTPAVSNTVTGNAVYIALWEKDTIAPKPKTNENVPPKTGDTSRNALWTVLQSVAAVGLIGTVFYSKKKKSK